MRKLLLVGSMAVAACVNAAVISPKVALQRAGAVPGFKAMSTDLSAQPVLVYTETVESQPAAYLFTRGNAGGYIVVSADDEATPLLGYADEGSLDPDNMPDGLKYWLGYYAAEIGSARAGAAASMPVAPAVSDRTPIAPMVTTRWNQSAPYNNLCPTVGSNRTVTGCVATAMAQVMKYHNWPPKGTDSNSYSWGGTTLSVDYASTTYDWANMLDEYSSSATTAQNTAVATLMYSCGVSVNMNYGTGASGAVSRNCGTALVNYFNYDASLRYLSRDYYSLSDWEDEVYNSLAEGCPVLYGGQSNAGGHEFVCDGYSSDGFFHFNWGWGGMSDGYFKLTALTPGSQGIGGAGNGAGYNFDQDIIVGIKPYAGQSDFTPSLANSSDFSFTSSSATLGSRTEVSFQLSNDSYVTVAFKPGIAITDAAGNTVYQVWYYTNELSLQPGYGYTSPIAFNVLIPSNLADGVYTVTPAFVSSGTWYPVSTKVGCVGSVTMTVSNGVATFASPEASLPQVDSYSFVNPTLYSGMAYAVNGTIQNPGELEYYGPVYGMVVTSSGNKLLPAMQVDLAAGESQEFEYSGTLPSTITAGEYQFMFVVKSSDGYTPISDSSNITVSAAPASTSLTLGKVSFLSGSNTVPKNDLGVQTSLTCNSGAYYGTLDLVVFYNVSGNQWQSCAEFPSETLYLNQGDTSDVVYHSDFSNGTVGDTYLLMFYYGNKRFSSQTMMVLGDATSSAPVITAVDEPVEVELYNLSGQRVGERPAPGHYIMVKRAADGSTTSQHLIIK